MNRELAVAGSCLWTSGDDEEPQFGQQEGVQLEAFGDLPDILTIDEVTDFL